jgi:benzoyl-CoA reductase subunit C
LNNRNTVPGNIAAYKQAGSKVIGYYCCYLPVELFTAAGIVPWRITADPGQDTTQADAVLETVLCPWVRSSFAAALEGRYAFLDGIVVPHVCDAVQRLYGFWKHYLKLPYSHYLEIPHTAGASSVEFFARELESLWHSFEEFSGRRVTPLALQEAIRAHNVNRSLVRQLYQLRKQNPSTVSGGEILKLLSSGLQQPVADFNDALSSFIREAGLRQPGTGRRPRVAISGCVIDNPVFFSMVEEYGAEVVMDDLPVGTRSFWFTVQEGADPVVALAQAYLNGVRCPRTVAEKHTKPFQEDLAERFGYLLEYAREYRVHGFILNLMHYCDCHEFDAPDLKAFLQDAGYPVMVLDDDYSPRGTQRLKTRLDTFLEILRARS